MAKVRIKIKELGEQRSCDGIHFGITPAHGSNPGVNPCRRKLEPTEVLEMDEDDALFEAIFDTGLVELTREMPTRPLDFANVREAELTSPAFKSTGSQDDADRAAAQRDVERRLFPELASDEVAKGQEFQDATRRQRRRQVAQLNEAHT